MRSKQLRKIVYALFGLAESISELNQDRHGNQGGTEAKPSSAAKPVDARANLTHCFLRQAMKKLISRCC